jgi:hypothetical protein
MLIELEGEKPAEIGSKQHGFPAPQFGAPEAARFGSRAAVDKMIDHRIPPDLLHREVHAAIFRVSGVGTRRTEP